MRAPSGAAFVNQALAMKLAGLDPSGFNPHAFARSGLRAPLTSGLRPAHRPAGRLARPSAIPCAAHQHRMDAGAERSTQCQNIAQGTLRSEAPLPDNLPSGFPGSTATIRRRRAGHQPQRAPGRRVLMRSQATAALKSVYFPRPPLGTLSSPGERRRQAVCRFSRVRESRVCVLPGCQIEADSAHDGEHGF